MSEQKPKAIAWRDEYSIGIPSLDDQHKRLLAMLNQLNSLDNDVPSTASPSPQLVDMLDYLNDYAADHFSKEEALMREHLPTEKTTADHLVAHRTYWAIIAALKKRLLRGDAKVNRELVEYLNNWWINHILATDQQMGRELSRRGVS